MGWLGITAAALLISGVTADAAEEKSARSTPFVVPAASVIAAAPVTLDVDDPQVSARRLSVALVDRLKPIEARFRDDARLREAGAVIGLGAVALGALRREQGLTVVGAGALRLGLHRRLSAIEQTTGFSVWPRVEHRGFSILLTKKFD